MLAELHVDEGRIVLDRIVAAVDWGRMIHPDIVRQQIEGGIIWGISGSMGEAISIERGLVTARNFDGLGLPMLADTSDNKDRGGIAAVYTRPRTGFLI